MRADLQRLKRDSESGNPLPSCRSRPRDLPPASIGFLAAAVLFVHDGDRGDLVLARHKTSASQIESMAVIPFTNSGGNADTDFLSDGLTESLIASLAHVPDLKVKSRNSVFRYKGKEIDVQQVGKELTVDALLTGRSRAARRHVQVSADLTNVKDNTEIWGEQYERKASDILGLQQQIASDIAGQTALEIQRRGKTASHEARHTEPRGLSALRERPLLLEQAHGRGP